MITGSIRKPDWLDKIQRGELQEQRTYLPESPKIQRHSMPQGKIKSISFTGYGDDDELQEENPVDIVNTKEGPKTIHEGEIKIDLNGKTIVIPADKAQEVLIAIEKTTGMEGYQKGGVYEDDQLKPKTISAIENPTGYGPDEKLSTSTTLPTSETPNVKPPVIDTTLKPPTPKPITSIQEQTTTPPVTVPNVPITPVLKPPTPVIQQTTNTQTTTPPVTTGTQQGVPPVTQLTQAQLDAIEYYKKLASGQNPVMEQISNKAQQDLQAQQAWQATKQKQELATSAGQLPSGTAQAITSMQQRDQGLQTSQLMSDLSKNWGIASQDAVNKVFTMSSDLDRQNWAKQNDEYNKNWNQIEKLLAVKDFQGAANAWKQAGMAGSLDVSKLEKEYKDAQIAQNVGKIDKLMNNISGLLQSGMVDENTAQAMGKIFNQGVIAQMGLLAGNTFSQADWNNMFNSLANTGTVQSTPQNNEMLKASKSFIDKVTMLPEWFDFKSNNPKLFDGTEANTIKIGQVAAALIGLNSGKITDSQRKLLGEVGLYSEQDDVSLLKTQEAEKLKISEGVNAVNNYLKSGQEQLAIDAYNKLPDTWKKANPYESTFKLGNMETLLKEGTNTPTLNQADLKKVASTKNPKFVVEGAQLAGDLLYWNDTDHSGSKSKRWSVKPEVAEFITANKGKIANINGTDYLIVGEIVEDVNDRNNVAQVKLYNIDTGKYEMVNGRGNVAGKPNQPTAQLGNTKDNLEKE